MPWLCQDKYTAASTVTTPTVVNYHCLLGEDSHVEFATFTTRKGRSFPLELALDWTSPLSSGLLFYPLEGFCRWSSSFRLCIKRLVAFAYVNLRIKTPPACSFLWKKKKKVTSRSMKAIIWSVAVRDRTALFCPSYTWTSWPGRRFLLLITSGTVWSRWTWWFPGIFVAAREINLSGIFTETTSFMAVGISLFCPPVE